jgi:uncharacterized protein YqhQ
MSEIHMGGQAVVEGVLMRTRTEYAIAVRNNKGKIIVKKEDIKSANIAIFKLPILRGMLALYETLAIGFKALMYSANVSAGEDEALSRKEMVIAVIISITLAIGLFIGLPFVLASAVTKHNLLFNIVDGILRMAVLLLYLLFISFFKDVQRLFQYHGAEHMTIHAFEKHIPLTPKNIRKFPTMHPRCGTSFLLIVVLLSIVVFSAITTEDLLLKFLSRIALVPLIAGIAYEWLKFAARHVRNPFLRPLILPGIWLQYITTKRPDDSQIQVAVTSLKALQK